MNIHVESQEYRDKVLEGIDLATRFIKKSYGYNGKSIVIKRDNASNHMSNDGVTIANSIYSDDPIVDIGCDIVRKATKMVEEKVKNNTTTTAILIDSLIKGLSTIVDNSNVIELKQGLNRFIDEVIQGVVDMSIKVEDSNSIAYDSCHDADMANFTSSLLEKNDEYYELNSVPSDKYSLERKDGATFDLFAFGTNLKDMKMDNPFVLMYENTVENSFSLSNIFNVIKDQDAVVILKDITPAMLSSLKAKINSHNASIICFIGFNGKEQVLREIKTIYHNVELNFGNGTVPIVKFDKIKKIEGSIKNIHITGETNKDATRKIIKESKSEFSECADQLKAEKIKKKINRHMGRTYKISLKGNEYNFEGQKDKFLDTVNDVINFNNSNNIVVAGGGVIYKDLAYMLKDKYKPAESDEDVMKIIPILIHTLLEPMRVLLNNSYVDSSSLSTYKKYHGYDASKRVETSMIDSKILTPVKSIITSLEIVRDVGIEWLFTDGAIYMP